MDDPIAPATQTPGTPAPKATPPAQAHAPAPTDTNLMDDAAGKAKAEEQTENNRLLNADPKDLNDADRTKRETLVKAKEEAEKQNAIPEKYELKMTEGVTLDQGLLDAVTPLFKEAKVSQATAQKLADAFTAYTKSKAEAKEKADQAAFDAYVKGLKDETLKTLGAEADKQLIFAAKARDRLMSKELVDKLNASGIANDVHMIKFLIDIGQKISETPLKEGSSGGGGQKSATEILYDKKQ